MDVVDVAMTALRKPVDKLEMLVDSDIWPMPYLWSTHVRDLMKQCNHVRKFPVHARMRQGSSLNDYSAKHATEKKHEVRIRGWHCPWIVAKHATEKKHEVRIRGRHCAVKYKKLKFPIDFLKAISYDMPNK